MLSNSPPGIAQMEGAFPSGVKEMSRLLANNFPRSAQTQIIPKSLAANQINLRDNPVTTILNNSRKWPSRILCNTFAPIQLARVAAATIASINGKYLTNATPSKPNAINFRPCTMTIIVVKVAT